MSLLNRIRSAAFRGWPPFSANVGRRLFPPAQTTSSFYEAPDDVPYNMWREFDHEMERIGQTTMGHDHFYDSQFNRFTCREQPKLSYDEKGIMHYQIDMTGYKPEDVIVEMHEAADNHQSPYVVIHGEHNDKTGDEMVHREFTRRFRIPDGIKLESIKCDLDKDGTMCVSGESIPAAMNANDAHKIPITVGKAHKHDKECEDAEQANEDMVAEGGHKDEMLHKVA